MRRPAGVNEKFDFICGFSRPGATAVIELPVSLTDDVANCHQPSALVIELSISSVPIGVLVSVGAAT
jgi:hypothetical protein